MKSLHTSSRRRLTIALAGGLFSLMSLGTNALAADVFPNRPLKLVLMFPAGGGSSDRQLRMLAERLRVELGQPVIVENRVGGGGILAAEYVKGEPADGHTILWSGIALMTLTPKFSSGAKYSAADFTPVASLGTTPNVLIANSNLGLSNVADLVNLARRSPGKISYGTWGIGSVTHVAGEWLSRDLGIALNPVPYRGEVPLINDMLGGHVDIGWSSLPSALPYLNSGKFKALGITSSTRDPKLPQVKTIAEQGVPDFSIQGWTGLFVRKGTPPNTVKRLHSVIDRILQEPEMQSSAETSGYNLPSMSIEQFQALMDSDAQKMMRTLDQLVPQIRQ